jgi:hypothetical protein
MPVPIVRASSVIAAVSARLHEELVSATKMCASASITARGAGGPHRASHATCVIDDDEDDVVPLSRRRGKSARAAGVLGAAFIALRRAIGPARHTA